MGFDFMEFDNRLADKGVPRECPACGETDRYVAANPTALLETKPDGYVQVFQADEANRAVVAVFAGTVICNNCGLIRMHALKALDIDFP